MSGFLQDRRLRALLLGQLISVLVASTGVFSTLLADDGVQIPTTQSLLNYLLLACNLLVRSAKLGCSRTWALQVAAWRYALVALADVEANFLVVKAYSQTTITSIMLIDCWTIPCSMLLSWLFLKRRYTRRHLLGVIVCVVGLAGLVVSDWLRAKDAEANGSSGSSGSDSPPPSNPVLGDLLCFAGATLYAVSNVAQESLVKRHDRVEFLGMLGFFGSIINAAQLAILERDELAALHWTPRIAGSLLGFAAALFCMYELTSRFLVTSDAVLFNLSLLTSDVWAILAAVLLFGQALHWLYFLSFAIIVVGLFLYNTAPDIDAGSATSASTIARDAGDAIGSGGGGRLQAPAAAPTENDSLTAAARSSQRAVDLRPLAATEEGPLPVRWTTGENGTASGAVAAEQSLPLPLPLPPSFQRSYSSFPDSSSGMRERSAPTAPTAPSPRPGLGRDASSAGIGGSSLTSVSVSASASPAS